MYLGLKKNQSTHGLQLLHELSQALTTIQPDGSMYNPDFRRREDNNPMFHPKDKRYQAQLQAIREQELKTHHEELSRHLIEPKLTRCLEFVEKDINACLLKSATTGNNAYHLLVGSDFPKEFILPLLEAFLNVNSIGASATNMTNNTPLHFSLSQPIILIEVALKLLKAYPDATTIKNQDGLIPLFLAVMRDNSNFELCKELVKANPLGPQTENKRKSFPLHFACKRRFPNKDILRMLLRRYPEATQRINLDGVLPLHIITGNCYDISAIRIVYEAWPDAISVKDRYGKTCLHHAVLAVGKEHMETVAREQEEEKQILQRSSSLDSLGSAMQNFHISRNNSEDDFEDFNDTKSASSSVGGSTTAFDPNDAISDSKRSALYEPDTKVRDIIRYIIYLNPLAIVENNNFEARPVDTVIKPILQMKKKASRQKKIIQYYGVYDDQPTSRLLLCQHRLLHERHILPAMEDKYVNMLCDLNWLARRDALLVSFTGMRRQSDYDSFQDTNVSKTSKTTSMKTTTQLLSKQQTLQIEREKYYGHIIGDEDGIPKHNFLARFRHIGHTEISRLIITFI